MRHDIIDRQAQAMNAAGLDAILSCSPENFAYVDRLTAFADAGADCLYRGVHSHRR